jgi:hypothetical protein
LWFSKIKISIKIGTADQALLRELSVVSGKAMWYPSRVIGCPDISKAERAGRRDHRRQNF